jgi:hypothetical protein
MPELWQSPQTLTGANSDGGHDLSIGCCV